MKNKFFFKFWSEILTLDLSGGQKNLQYLKKGAKSHTISL